MHGCVGPVVVFTELTKVPIVLHRECGNVGYLLHHPRVAVDSIKDLSEYCEENEGIYIYIETLSSITDYVSGQILREFR